MGLWFEGSDPVAIHALASAGADLVRDIAVSLRRPVVVGEERLLKETKPERHAEVRRLIRRSQNFLKHADRDSDAMLEFETGEADMRLLGACTDYRLVAASPSPVLLAFETYAAITWANHLLEDRVRVAFPQDLQTRIAALPRDEALYQLVEILLDDAST